MAKAHSPAQARDQARKLKRFPPEVIEAFNELIAENLNGLSSKFTQDAVVSRIMLKLDIPRAKIFNNKWLDIERTFEKAGWKVIYDKPGFCETYDASFEFRVKPKPDPSDCPECGAV